MTGLLASQVKETAAENAPIVLAMLFLQPGKHAGEGGDIDQLVESAQDRHIKLSDETGSGGAVSAKLGRRVILKTVRTGPAILLLVLAWLLTSNGPAVMACCCVVCLTMCAVCDARPAQPFLSMLCKC